MEDASAQFVVMIMDRLQESEKLNSKLLRRVQQVESELELHRQALPLDLRMRLNGTLDFSDGSWINWHLGEAAGLMVEDEESEVPKQVELDQAHGNATMFFGQHIVKCHHQLGGFVCFELGKSGQRSTVREFVDDINCLVREARPGSRHWGLQLQEADGFTCTAPGLLEVDSLAV